jgi:hypothetical protein
VRNGSAAVCFTLEIPTAVATHSTVFWQVKLYLSVSVRGRFEGTYSLCFQDRNEQLTGFNLFYVRCFLNAFLTMKMETAITFETSVSCYQTTEVTCQERALMEAKVCSSIHLFVYMSIYLSICLSVCLSIYLSVYLSVCLSIYLSVYLSICLSIYLSVCLSIYELSIYLHTYQSTCLSNLCGICGRQMVLRMSLSKYLD